MKHSYIFLFCAAIVTNSQCSQGTADPIIASQAAIAQHNIDNIIAQSNMDPLMAGALTAEINNLIQQASANMQQDKQDIQVASALSMLLTTAQSMMKTNASLASYSSLLTNLKYAAHTNTIQKLLIGAFPAQLRDYLYYTDPYTETIGFTLNDYFFNTVLTALATVIAPTAFGKALSLNPTSRQQALLIRVTGALTAQLAWLLQKKFVISPLLNQAQAQQQATQNQTQSN